MSHSRKTCRFCGQIIHGRTYTTWRFGIIGTIILAPCQLLLGCMGLPLLLETTYDYCSAGCQDGDRKDPALTASENRKSLFWAFAIPLLLLLCVIIYSITPKEKESTTQKAHRADNSPFVESKVTTPKVTTPKTSEGARAEGYITNSKAASPANINVQHQEVHRADNTPFVEQKNATQKTGKGYITDYKASYPETINAQKRAIKKYPDLGIEGSRFNREFVARFNKYKIEKPNYFQDPDWPTTLADEIFVTYD